MVCSRVWLLLWFDSKPPIADHTFLYPLSTYAEQHSMADCACRLAVRQFIDCVWLNKSGTFRVDPACSSQNAPQTNVEADNRPDRHPRLR